MATAAEIRARVVQANALVEEAQHALRIAEDKLNQSRTLYFAVESTKLNGVIAAVNSTADLTEQAQRSSSNITSWAMSYAMTV